MLSALLAVKNSPNRHAADGRLACHGRQGGGAVGVAHNLAQDATVRAHRAAAAAAAPGEILGLEATFERDLSLGYCSSAQAEHRLAHELDRAGAIGRGGATARRPQCGLFVDFAKSTFDCETARLRHPNG